MPFNARWKSILAKHMAAVPKGSTFARYQAAVKAASAEYRGERVHRSNPGGEGSILTPVILAVAGWYGYQYMLKQQAPALPPAEQQTGT